MKTFLILAASLLLSPAAFGAGQDFLAKETLKLDVRNPEAALDRTMADLGSVFRRYTPALNAGASLQKPLRVSGSSRNPVITMTFKKCFLGMLCEVVPFKGELSLRETRGNCDRNSVLETDLRGSGDIVKGNYQRLEVSFCYNQPSSGPATLAIEAVAVRASSFSSGLKQGEVLKLLRLQVRPMMAALQKTIKLNAE